MKLPEKVLRELVEQWVAKAELDYEAASRLMRDSDRLREIIAFHCQQAGEKYLKALLVRHQVEFPKTHNLRQLLDLLSCVTPEMATYLDSAATLTPYGVDIRYPGDFPEVPVGEESALFEIACRVRDTIMGELGPFLAQP